MWVDRLCIIQDDPKITTQLEQMAAIYSQAAVTLVAAAGGGAAYGLPGVSRPRNSTRLVLKYNSKFEIVDEIPKLVACLSRGTWRERGWTYQEQEASSALLYFTDHGLFYLNKNLESQPVNAEGRTAEDVYEAPEHDLHFVTEYSRRKLTHASDRLRAVSGILQALYGERSHCGMPWDNFDVAILRYDQYGTDCEEIETDMFPTWSWLACPAVVGFPLSDPLYGLACWGYGKNSTRSTSAASQWASISRVLSLEENVKESFNFYQDTQVGAALACLHGCIRAKIPRWLAIDCSRDDYVHRLARNWRKGNSKFWNELLEKHRDSNPFEAFDSQKVDNLDRIITHTQKATFATDWKIPCVARRTSSPTARGSVVRTRTGQIAGFVEIDRRVAVPVNYADISFIALSVTSDFELAPKFGSRDKNGLDISKIYGCGCSQAMEPAPDLDHIPECPSHPEFYHLEAQLQFIDDWSRGKGIAKKSELAFTPLRHETGGHNVARFYRLPCHTVHVHENIRHPIQISDRSSLRMWILYAILE